MTERQGARSVKADEPMPETSGAWDQSPRVADQPWHEPAPAATDSLTWRPARRAVMIGFALVLLLAVGLITTSLVANFRPSKIAYEEPAGPMCLRALHMAQTQYFKQQGFYAASGAELNSRGTLIAADLSHGCEAWQNNGDGGAVSPKAGMVYRMLQGPRSGNATGYWNAVDDATQGMRAWGATARAAEPGTSGNAQYFIAADGVVYQHDEPDLNSPQFKQYLLDGVPTAADLERLGWTVYKPGRD